MLPALIKASYAINTLHGNYIQHNVGSSWQNLHVVGKRLHSEDERTNYGPLKSSALHMILTW